MSESLYPPFLHWGECKSKDEKNPDIIKVEVLELETFETEFSTNIRAKVDGVEKNIPLQSFESKNKQLLQLWSQAVKDGRSEEHTSELQSRSDLVCRLLLEKKKINQILQL